MKKKKSLVGWAFESSLFNAPYWKRNSAIFDDYFIKIPYIYKNKGYIIWCGGETDKDKLKKVRITLEELL